MAKGRADRGAFDAIGEVVRRELAHRGLNQRELAERSGVDYYAVRAWLGGGRGLRSDRVAQILDVLGLEVTRRRR